jgi:hypothetical protein
MEKTIDGTSWIDINQAAETLGSTIPKLLILIKEGTLIGQQLDGEWYVTSDSICNCSNRGEVPHIVKSCSGGCGGGCGSK